MRSLALMACLAACNGGGTGSLELTLTLPAESDLRPTGMTTVTVTASAPGEPPISTTSVLVDNQFAAGDLPVGEDIQIGVVLRDVSNRIVGVGQAGQTVDILGDQATELAIPVRRPFVYASSGSALVSFDPTLDPRAPRFQGTLAGVTAPRFTISVGGDRLAVVSDAQVQIVETATNTIAGSITVPSGARDAAAVPGTHKLAIAHATGISIVDLDTNEAVTAEVGPVDRVSVGPDGAGALLAYGLVGRVAPPDLPPPMGACTGSSSLVRVSVDAPAPTTPVSLGAAVSDLAAAPNAPMLFAALPCAGQVARVTGDIDIAGVALENLSALERASALTVQGDRVYAAGTATATPFCDGPCDANTQVACPATQSNTAIYASEGARIVVQSIPFDGASPIVLEMPGRRETIIDTEDDARQHAQVLKAMGAVPIDLVTLPGGQYLAVLMESRYYIASLVGGTIGTVLPCLDVSTSDWQLIDLASSSIAQRVRTYCNVDDVGSSTLFPSWDCDLPPEGERNALPLDYLPTSVGALFGAR